MENPSHGRNPGPVGGTKPVFNHDSQDVHTALGIPEERAKQLTMMLAEWIIKHGKISRIIEEIYDNKELDNIEKLFLAWLLGAFSGSCRAGLTMPPIIPVILVEKDQEGQK